MREVGGWGGRIQVRIVLCVHYETVIVSEGVSPIKSIIKTTHDTRHTTHDARRRRRTAEAGSAPPSSSSGTRDTTGGI